MRYLQDGNELDVLLKLDKGLPDTRYDVGIGEVGPTGCVNYLPGGRMRTDENGRDDAEPYVVLDSGVTNFFAVIRAPDGSDPNVYRTRLMPVAPAQAKADNADNADAFPAANPAPVADVLEADTGLPPVAADTPAPDATADAGAVTDAAATDDFATPADAPAADVAAPPAPAPTAGDTSTAFEFVP